MGGGGIGGPPIKKMGSNFFVIIFFLLGARGRGGSGRGGKKKKKKKKKWGPIFFSFSFLSPPFPSHLQLLDAKMTCPCVLWWGGGYGTVDCGSYAEYALLFILFFIVYYFPRTEDCTST